MKIMKYYEETNALLHEFSEDNQQYLELERTDFSSICQYDCCPPYCRFSAPLL